jgi:hypothetical protein
MVYIHITLLYICSVCVYLFQVLTLLWLNDNMSDKYELERMGKKLPRNLRYYSGICLEDL